MGLFEDVVSEIDKLVGAKKPAEPAVAEPDFNAAVNRGVLSTVQPEIGVIPAIGKQLVAGTIYDVPRAAQQTMAAGGRLINDIAGGPTAVGEFLRERGQLGSEAVTAAETGRPDLAPSIDPRERPIASAFEMGSRSIPQSALAMVGTVANPVIGAAGTIGLFGGQGSEDTYQKVFKALSDSGMSQEEAHQRATKAGYISGMAQGGGEVLGNVLLGGMLTAGGRLGRHLLTGVAKQAKTGVDVMRQVADPKMVKEFAKNFTGAMVGEPLTEGLQDATTAWAERQAGVPGETPEKAFIKALGPAAAMTLMMAPLGIPGSVSVSNRMARLKNALLLPETSEQERASAVMAVAEEMAKVDPIQAKNLIINGGWAIDRDLPITLTEDFLKDPGSRFFPGTTGFQMVGETIDKTPKKEPLDVTIDNVRKATESGGKAMPLQLPGPGEPVNLPALLGGGLPMLAPSGTQVELQGPSYEEMSPVGTELPSPVARPGLPAGGIGEVPATRQAPPVPAVPESRAVPIGAPVNRTTLGIPVGKPTGPESAPVPSLREEAGLPIQRASDVTDQPLEGEVLAPGKAPSIEEIKKPETIEGEKDSIGTSLMLPEEKKKVIEKPAVQPAPVQEATTTSPKPVPTVSVTAPAPVSKERWEMTQDEYATTQKGKLVPTAWIKKRREAHKKSVIKAIEEGKSVPKNVLKDYPGLKEEINAKTVRSDEGQVRQGSEEGQSKVQPSPEQGGGNIQQPASKEPHGTEHIGRADEEKAQKEHDIEKEVKGISEKDLDAIFDEVEKERAPENKDKVKKKQIVGGVDVGKIPDGTKVTVTEVIAETGKTYKNRGVDAATALKDIQSDINRYEALLRCMRS